MANFVKLKREGILKIEIIDENDKPTGEYLEFDLEDIELPLRYQECMDSHKKNVSFLKNQFVIIEKKQDVKGKKLFSKNEEEKIRVLNEFYKKEMDSLDLFLGTDGTKKLLNGRKPYFTMFDDISEIIEPILPELEKSFKGIETKIKDKYKQKEEKVLE